MQPRSGRVPPARAVSTADIRESNTALVYDLLRHRGPSTRADIVQGTALARPTIVAIVADLLGSGLVVERMGHSSPRGGRPSSVLAIEPLAHTVAAARLRGRFVEMVLADAAGTEIARNTWKRPPESAPWSELVEGLGDQVLALHEQRAVGGPLSSLALALPGSINRTAGSWSLARKPAWRDIPLTALLTDRLQVPVAAVNIAAAALAGHLTREPEHATSAALVFVGRGVGSAFTVDGRLVDGSSGSAGELGHCTVPGLRTRCSCGRTGCVETVTRIPYLARQYTRLTGSPAPATLAEMEQHPSAEFGAVLDAAARQLGVAASWLVDIVNPGAVFLGGDAVAGADRFRAGFETALRSSAHGPNVRSLHTAPAVQESAVLGAVRLATELLPDLVAPRLRLVRTA